MTFLLHLQKKHDELRLPSTPWTGEATPEIWRQRQISKKSDHFDGHIRRLLPNDTAEIHTLGF